MGVKSGLDTPRGRGSCLLWNSGVLTQFLTGHTGKVNWSLGKYLVTPTKWVRAGGH